MERFVSKLISFLSCLVFRSAGEVHRRPAFAIVLYVTALAGVLASTFGRGAGRPSPTPHRPVCSGVWRKKAPG